MRRYIVIKTERKYRKIFIDEILYCMAEGAYTKLYLNNNEEIYDSKILKVVEKTLSNYNFFRINRSYLVNLDHCYELLTGEKPNIILSNKVKLCVSPPKMKNLRKLFCAYS
ncbi:MAG TPA: hypothetical protein DCG75_01875 [Bacteroidales bacterium]|nr:hypothetical protein [Bacteroidales bacterium]